MFVVRGFDDGVAYTVEVDNPATPEERRDGFVAGSEGVRALLRLYEGETFKVTPTGPVVTLNLNDGASVLGALYALTRVTEVTGDAPDLLGPPVHGAVY